MTTRTKSRAFRPAVSGLEPRRVPATFVGPVSAVPVITADFDATLSAVLRTKSDGSKYFEVDGSDYEDTVRVLALTPGLGGSVTLQLEQYYQGSRISSRTATYRPGLAFMANEVVVFGKGARDTIVNDTAARLTAHGGEGNDWLVGGSGSDFLYGNGGVNTIEGRNGDDWIYGGDQADYVYAGEGNDLVYGFGGDDYLQGGGGNDQVFGSSGHDVIFGNAGNDLLYGESGNDRIYGDNGDDSSHVAGWDVIYGGSGNDTAFGDAGDDLLYGDYTTIGEGDHDLLYGGKGNDWFYGGPGNDRIYGQAGSDRLLGEDGVDHLDGGDDDDYLDGGYRAYASPGDSISVGDTLVGGRGKDKFVKHRSVFGFDDIDHFYDYNRALGDSIVDDWHW